MNNPHTPYLREATGADAAGVLQHLKTVLSEGPVDIPKLASEVVSSVDETKHFLESLQCEPHSLFLVAEVEGQIVGNIDIIGHKRQALRHVSVLGIAIQKAYRGQGVGKKLMEEALAWVREATDIRRLELYVYVRNTSAIKLYQRYGFVIEGQRKGYVYDQGEYLDDYVMGLWLEKPNLERETNE